MTALGSQDKRSLTFQSFDFNLKIVEKNNAVLGAQLGAQLQWYTVGIYIVK